MGYINSASIKVFPCGGRNKDSDPLARLTTEYNLVSIINRLVDKDSFIVTTHENGTRISDTKYQNEYYQVNIGGYLFTINAVKDIFDAAASTSSEGQYLNASIRVDTDSYYQQLGPLTELPSYTYDNGILDNDYGFVGISFDCSDEKFQNTSELTLFERSFVIDDETGTYYLKSDGNYTKTEPANYIGKKYSPTNNWVECEDSKIKFETKIDGSARSVRIDDGELLPPSV